MMKALQLAAIAGLASGAAAQTGSWTLIGALTTDGDSAIEPWLGESSATLRFALGMDPGPGESLPDGSTVLGFASVIGQFIGDTNWQGGVVTWSMNPDLIVLTGDLTEIGGPGYGTNDLHEVNAGQVIGFGPFSTDDPIAIIDINWDANGDYTPRDVNVSAQVEDPDTIQVHIREPGLTYDTVAEYPTEDLNVSFRVIPAPASVVLSALGGLVATRRRRK